MKHVKNGLKIGLGIVVVLLLITAALTFGRRPRRTDVTEQWFQGVSYERRFLDEQRPVLLHLVTIDLSAPGIRFVTTEPDPSGGMEMVAQTVRWFAQNYETQVAINASFFYPFHSNHPFDYYPHIGDPVSIRGLGIANGVIYSDDNLDSATLCLQDNVAEIREMGCPARTQIGLASLPLLLFAGEPITDLDEEKLAPRTVVALDAQVETMWFILVDGRQPGYSEGMTLAEVARFAQEIGADRAINFDGGGSTTLIADDDGRYRTVNATIHTRVPMRLRPVGNHLGVHALPLE